MSVLLLPPIFQFFDNNGDPLANGFVDTFAAGTNTRLATFTDSTGTIPAPNPIELNPAGRPNSGSGAIWGEGAYKFIVRDSAGAQVGNTLDNVISFNALTAATAAYAETFSGNGVQTVFTTSESLGTEEKGLLVSVASGLQEIAVNGSFATDTSWTKGAGWTIAAGVATATGAISTALSQVPVISLVVGQAYAVTYTITRSAGGLIPSLGGYSGVERTASGTYREIIIAASTTPIAFTGNSFTGTLDNVSITAAVNQPMALQPVAAYTINGTSLTFATAPALGINNIDVRAPTTLLGAASAAATLAQTYAANALTSETNAAASATSAAASATSAAGSATNAAGQAAGYTATSTTSVLIGTGAKSFTIQTGKNFIAAQFISLISNASAANYFHGSVTSYNTGTGDLVVNVTDIGGSGTFADWVASLSGSQGATGPLGGGDMLKSDNLSGLANITTARTNIAAAPLASPTFTGTPAAPTAAAGTNTAQLATTAFVNSALSGVGGVLSKQIYTATGAFTFTTSSTITTSTVFKITLTGGGAGAGGGLSGSGGGGAATIIFWASGLSPSTGYSGSTGTGGAGSTTSGSNGGDTTITIGATTYTGGGGTGGVSGGNGGAGGSGTNGQLTIPGQRGGRGMTSSSINLGGHGGSSFWGGGGSNNANGVAGYSGAAYGSGGSGAATAGLAGGSGANGVALIEWQ